MTGEDEGGDRGKGQGRTAAVALGTVEGGHLWALGKGNHCITCVFWGQKPGHLIDSKLQRRTWRAEKMTMRTQRKLRRP